MAKHIEAKNQPCLQGALSMGEVRFREALEGLPDAFILLSVVRDESGRVIDFCVDYANHLALAIAGQIREEYVGRHLLEVFPGVRELGLFDAYVWVVETGEPFFQDSFIYKVIIDEEETTFPVDIRVSKIGDGAVVIWRDVSERVNAEEALIQERELFLAIIENIPVYLVIWDGRLQEFRFNEAFRRDIGWTEADAAEGDFMAKVYPDPEYRHEAEEYMRSLTPGFRDLKTTAKDGQMVDIAWANVQLSDDRSIGIGVNITDRKQAEEALRETEHDLNRAQSIAHIGSWRMDVQHNVLLWSDETYRIFDIPKGTLLTYEAFLDAVHSEDREYVDQKWTAALHGEPYNIEHRIIVGNTVKWVHETAELEFNKHKKLLGGFGTVQDITDRKLAEEKLERALDEAEQESRRVAAMESIAEAGISAFETQQLFNTLAERIAKGMNTHSCTIFLLDEETDELEACSAHNIPEECGFRIKATEGFTGKVASTRRTVYIHDAQNDPLVINPHIKRKGARSLLGTPLVVRGKLIGVVYVDILEIREFSVKEVRLFELMATRAALILDNARLRDEVLQSHETIQHQLTLLQRALLPPETPTIGADYCIAEAYIPGAAGLEIGGDFYDVFMTENGKAGILIGDVSGKGIEAASLAAATRSTIRAFKYEMSSTSESLTHANSVLCDQQPETGYFVTVFLATLDLSSGCLCYGNAGHPPAAVYRAESRSVEFLTYGQPPVGLVEKQKFDEYESHLELGDKIILYTDGITEARRNSEMFGEERLECVLKEHGHLAPDDLVDKLLSAASEWAHGRFMDDVAIIVVERQIGEPHQ